jgi:chromosome segregation ATPase
MVADILENLKEEISHVRERLEDVPERLKGVRGRLEDAPEKLQERGQEVGRKLRGRIGDLVDEGEERAWELEKRALMAAGGLIERASEVPVVSGVAPRVEGAVQERLGKITKPPIADYDELNVKAIRAALGELERLDLIKVARYEEANKGRKTVLRDIDAELKRRRALAELEA